jgi:hypothetical protein
MMNLTTNWKMITPVTGIAVLFFWVAAGQNKSEGAGSLTPPEGIPTPTMPSLEEIGDKVDTLGSSGKNFAIRYATSVQVWNGETGAFTPAQTVTGLANVIESDGNFGARGSSGGAAWNKQTGTWSVVTNIQGANSMLRSNGNFCIVGSGKATAWSRVTGTWTTKNISIPGPISTSNGNFMIRGSSRIIAWSQKTGLWTEITPSSGFVGTVSAGN